MAFVGRLGKDQIVDRRPAGVAAGSMVRLVAPAELVKLLSLRKTSGFRVGTLTSQPEAVVEVSAADFSRSHSAIVEQTGSGKTNALRLVHAGMRIAKDGPGATISPMRAALASSARADGRMSPPGSTT